VISPTLNYKDFWTGLIYIFFGVSAIVISREYGMGTGVRMGPAYFPTVLGGLLSVIGAIAVVRSFLIPGTPIGAFAFKALVIVCGSVLLLGFFVRGAGLVITLPLLVIVSAAASTRFRFWATVFIAAGLTIFCVLVFIKGLGIPLPLIGPWIGGG
jgi:putative tricarboxylic transport membrane protein